jgi:cell division transport system permease protein
VKRLRARLGYLARTSLAGLRSSPVTTAVCVLTIGVSLVLVGAFALLLANMEELLARFGDDLQVTAYLADDLRPEQTQELMRIAKTVEGVQEARIVSKAEALERFRSGVGRGSALLEGLGENPLPASLELTLAPEHRSAAGMAQVVGSLEGLPGVTEIASGQDWVEGYLRAIALLRGIGWGLGLILALATLLIVANTIRLAVFARRDELQILSLVGASRAFVNAPFLVEGVLQGALAGALALGLLYALFRLVLPGFEFGLELLLGGVAPRFFAPDEMAALLVGGAGLGLVGSAAALAGAGRA